jgi:hypothetical protein
LRDNSLQKAMTDEHRTVRESMEIRDRVREFKRVSSAELMDNAGNWRRHPHAQRQALAGVLHEIGIAGALTAYHSERNDGMLTLIDGHLRKETVAGDWPVLILDLSDTEADKLLLAFDPLGAMAEADGLKLKALLAEVHTESEGFASLLDGLRRSLSESEVIEPVPPEQFTEYGDDIQTDFCCPKCGYAWSGKPQ